MRHLKLKRIKKIEEEFEHKRNTIALPSDRISARVGEQIQTRQIPERNPTSQPIAGEWHPTQINDNFRLLLDSLETIYSMIKPSKHKISNGYTKLKSIRQFEGYKVTSYGASFIKNPSYVE